MNNEDVIDIFAHISQKHDIAPDRLIENSELVAEILELSKNSSAEQIQNGFDDPEKEKKRLKIVQRMLQLDLNNRSKVIEAQMEAIRLLGMNTGKKEENLKHNIEKVYEVAEELQSRDEASFEVKQ